MAPGDAQLDDASGCLVSQGANSRCGFIRGGIAMRGRGRGLIEVARTVLCPRFSIQLATRDFLVFEMGG